MTRQSLPPAKGLVKWVGTADNGNRLLSITPIHIDGTKGEAQTYEVDSVPGGFNLHNITHLVATGEFVHYELRYWANGLFMCNCPDAKNLPERKCQCKHTRGLLAALRSDPF